MLHHQESGSGAPSLVFVHGLTCALDDWDPQVNALAAEHRCIAVDLPGHGDTPANGPLAIGRFGATVAETVSALGAAPMVLIGHSMGCRVVLEAARILGDGVRGLVLVDGSLRGSGDPETIRDETREAIRTMGFSPYVAKLFEAMFTEKSDPGARAHIVERALRLDPDAGTELIADLAAFDAGQMDAVLDAVRVPVLVIQSTGVDEARNRVPLKAGDTAPIIERVRERVADTRVEIIEDIGHFTMLEAPQRVTALVSAFAREVGA